MNSLPLFAGVHSDAPAPQRVAASSSYSVSSSSAACPVDVSGVDRLHAPSQPALDGGVASLKLAVSSAAATIVAVARSAAGQPPPKTVDATSGPYLRTTIVLTCITFLLWMRHFAFLAPTLCMTPLVVAMTTGTSVLWCTPTELIVSLGPLPVCIFRRRFSYQDIRSVTAVQGRFRAFTAMFRKAICFWRIYGYIYAWTLGKEMIDIEVEPGSPAYKAFACFDGHLLVAVDEAWHVAELVLFRKEHGADAMLPPSLAARRPKEEHGADAMLPPSLAVRRPKEAEMSAKRWVRFDIFGALLRPWQGEDKVLCNVWDLLMQPWRQPTVHPMWRPSTRHARTA
eukprot:TRINITY_DN7972_c0_g1_i3.p1 TRINITY_DN7972_c0_g1~~TRINITY_DN7972_c0_g1_i3.p1  ORF type:complete len:340 (-),score=45.28 TRINITY_DN7972_c0_g1_i3:67-1086(-)